MEGQKMKKKLALLFTTVALTVTSVVPVFATVESLDAEKAIVANHMNGVTSAITTLVSFDNGCGEAEKTSMHALVNGFEKDVLWSAGQEEENYMKYLQARLGNAIEIERVKKQNIGAASDLVKVNPSLQPQLDAAIAEYNKAVADRQAAEAAIVNAKAQFDALNLAFVNANKDRATTDKDAR